MDAAYCNTVICEEIQAAGRVPLINHNPCKGEKREFTPHEAQRYKTCSGAERCNTRLKDEFGARHVQVRGHAKIHSCQFKKQLPALGQYWIGRVGQYSVGLNNI